MTRDISRNAGDISHIFCAFQPNYIVWPSQNVKQYVYGYLYPMYSFISAITSIYARDISKGACDISRTSRDLKAIFVRLVK